jgi:hypothetical protein
MDRAEINIVLNQQEREYLTELLKTTLKSTLVEEHRTRAPTYREGIAHREEMIRELLQKLSPATS